MEKVIFTVLTALLLGFTSHAQSAYDEGMKSALELWDQERAPEAVEIFEQLAEEEKDKWLPYYYASEIKIVKAFSIADAVQKEQQLKEAQELLDKAKEFAGDKNVELMVLQAMLHTAFITIDPYSRGQTLAPIVTDIYDTATRLSPENPRVALSRAKWNIGAAPYFGEDPSIYCGDLEASLKLFVTYKTEEPYAPSWGEDRARMLISEICEKK